MPRFFHLLIFCVCLIIVLKFAKHTVTSKRKFAFFSFVTIFLHSMLGPKQINHEVQWMFQLTFVSEKTFSACKSWSTGYVHAQSNLTSVKVFVSKKTVKAENLAGQFDSCRKFSKAGVGIFHRINHSFSCEFAQFVKDLLKSFKVRQAILDKMKFIFAVLLSAMLSDARPQQSELAEHVPVFRRQDPEGFRPVVVDTTGAETRKSFFSGMTF